VEDQQSAAGDLTGDAVEPAVAEVDESPSATKEDATSDAPKKTRARRRLFAGSKRAGVAAVPAAAAGGESPSTAIEDVTPAASDVASDEAPEADPEAPEATKTRRRLLTGKWAGVVAAAAAVLFVGSAAFAGATLQPYLTDRATAATKLKVAQTAANAITTLWTYTPENMDKLADRASGYLSGDFEAQYRKFVDAIVGPNKQAKITNSTQVTGAAVESLDGPDAVVIVYTNTTSTSPLNKNIPSLKYLSYRLFMKRANGHWLVTRMTTVTSLDLTPHV
jgi:Mce-associated membrane protein